MKLFERLKNVNKKWYLLLVIVLVIGAGGSIAAKIYFKQHNKRTREDNIVVRRVRLVEMDMLYIENSTTLKLTPDQAKQILPLIEKMSTSNSTSQTNLSRQIYEDLSPLQYQALMEHEKSVESKGIEVRGDDKDRHRHEDQYEFKKIKGKGYGDPKEDALNSVVIKMLKERSAENAQKPAS